MLEPNMRATINIIMGLFRFKDIFRNYDEALKQGNLCDWDVLRALGMASYEFFLAGAMLIYILKRRTRPYNDVIVWVVLCVIGFFLAVFAILMDCLVCGARKDEVYYFLFWSCYQVAHIYYVLKFMKECATRAAVEWELNREEFDEDPDPEPLYYPVPTYACNHAQRRNR